MWADFAAVCSRLQAGTLVWDAGRAAKHLDRIYREMPVYGHSDRHMSSNYG
jgi:hypothetical protein